MSLVGNGFTVHDASNPSQRLQASVVLLGGDDLNFTGGTVGPEGDLGFFFGNCGSGPGKIIIKKLGFEDLVMDVNFPIPTNVEYYLKRATTPVTPIGHLTADGPVFKSDGVDWRYKGVSAFKLAKKFEHGENIDGFLEDYKGFTVLRVWDYVPVKDWGATAWDSTPADVWIALCNYVATWGFHVELTLLTDDDPARIEPAKRLVGALVAAGVKNLLLEAGNEPTTHKQIDTHALKSTLEASGFLYTSGDYEDSNRFYGTYYVNHTPRNEYFARYGHELIEAYKGWGPDKPHRPFLCPCVGDEPGKIEDLGDEEKDWRALFGGYALMGAGGTFHSQTGKFADRPTDAEKKLIKVALAALDTFPAHAPRGPYDRIVEAGNEPGGPTEDARTYTVGPYAVRCHQVGTEFPETGWRALDADGILWEQAPF